MTTERPNNSFKPKHTRSGAASAEARRIKALPVGSVYTTRHESDVSELSVGSSGLRIVVTTSPHQSNETLWLEFFFEAFRGFRYLDEGDLIRYWESKAFTRGHHLFEITAGGWREQELQMPSMLSITDAFGGYREWFVCTTNSCVNVLSVKPPAVREFK